MRLLSAVRDHFCPPNKFVMPAILAIGFALRLIGIDVGLPDCPDPREVLIAQDILNLIHFTAPPEIYNWPGTAWFYLIALVGKVLSIGGFHLTEVRVIWAARFVNVLLSTGTLWFTYQLGLRCYNRRVGQIAAGFLAVAMLHATNESRFALVDIPATFCVTLFLSITARNTRLTFQTAVWLGIVAGISFAVKFTTVFVCFSLLHFIGTEKFYRRFATIIGVSALTFTLICPYWLVDLVSPEWNLFFEDFWYEVTHYHLGHLGLFATADTNWMHRFIYLWTLLKWGMGVPLALLISFGMLHAIAVHRQRRLLLLTFIIPYLLFIGVHKVKFMRHLLILYPVLTVVAGATLEHFVSSLRKRAIRMFGYHTSILPGPPAADGGRLGALAKIVCIQWGGILLGGTVALYSLVYTAAFAGVLLSQPTGVEASEWVSANIPQEESISRAPEILFDWLLPELDRELTDEEAEWALILLPNREVFRKYAQQPQSYQKQDWYPLSEIDVAGTLEFYERILGKGSRYELRQTFRRIPQFLGIRLSDSGAPFPMRALVHPDIYLYCRRAPSSSSLHQAAD